MIHLFDRQIRDHAQMRSHVRPRGIQASGQFARVFTICSIDLFSVLQGKLTPTHRKVVVPFWKMASAMTLEPDLKHLSLAFLRGVPFGLRASGVRYVSRSCQLGTT